MYSKNSFRIVLLVLTAGICFSCGKILPEKKENKEIVVPDISIQGKSYEKTGFIYVNGGIVKGKESFATDTVPVFLVKDGNEDDCHVLQNSIFAPKTTTEISSFLLGKYEVTQEFYEDVLNSVANSDVGINPAPSYFVYDIIENERQNLRPVERVSWFDAVYFCNMLSKIQNLDCVYEMSLIDVNSKTLSIENAVVRADFSKNGYRLPTQIEWEYACRGGNPKSDEWLFTYSGADELNSVAWYCTEGNYNIPTDTGDVTRIGKTHEVGLKTPNSLGFYDMTGNVQEWCQDEDGESAVARGGSWYRVDGECTVNFKVVLEKNTVNIGCGFRLCRVPYQNEL
ncbi:MAG: SUMF1/EgtB/PvdO family nonheme iron enzyme [Spirochaetaceae bacterium]|nr:SUMF1/EgtB/PvdO family nonheme iron enzyme [Spirochaetaceae bacterium]